MGLTLMISVIEFPPTTTPFRVITNIIYLRFAEERSRWISVTGLAHGD